SIVPATVLLLGVPGLAVTQVAGATGVAVGRPGLRTLAALVGLAATLTLDVLWIPAHGAAGASWASVCAYLASAGTAVVALAPHFRRSPARLLREAIGAAADAVARRTARSPAGPSPEISDRAS